VFTLRRTVEPDWTTEGVADEVFGWRRAGSWDLDRKLIGSRLRFAESFDKFDHKTYQDCDQSNAT